MKGLIRNNFYTVEGSLKTTVLIGFIAMILFTIISIFFPSSRNLAPSIIGGILGAFGALAGTAIQKDGASKWNKFELTMPISRNDVIKARYISFVLYILIGTFMALLSVLLLYVTVGDLNLERVGYGLIFGGSFAMSIPTFMTPLVLIFGSDKNEILLMVSIVINFVLFFGSSIVLTPFLTDFSNADLVFRLGYFIFSILLYFLSYLFSLCLYKKKEL